MPKTVFGIKKFFRKVFTGWDKKRKGIREFFNAC